jgi:pSer/pThr/pTyr-binding forkhead associated (FHA) protein
MVYQRNNDDLRTRLHRSPETVRVGGGLEDVLSQMNDPESAKNTINLLIYNQVEQVALAEEQSAVIGRSDAQTGYTPDIDLMRFNARKHGVSREHACIYLRGQQFYVMDLGSNNGSFMNGKALMPHHAQIIQHGDIIRFGLLEIQVEIR